MNKELLNTIISTITDHYDEVMRYDFGLRIVRDEEPIKAGTLLDHSRSWWDDVEARGDLPGTCAIKIDWNGNPDYLAEAAESALNLVSHYFGDQLLLITGDGFMTGEDNGEVIYRDAEVIASWNRA